MAKVVASKSDAHHMATLRQARDAALAQTDWTQLADARLHLGARVAEWDAYRAAWRKVVADAKAGLAHVIPPTPAD